MSSRPPHETPNAPSKETPNEISPRGASRRQFLGWAGGVVPITGAGMLSSLLLAGCPRIVRRDERFFRLWGRDRGRLVEIKIERALRPGPLEVNETLTLRRYRGHATPEAREAQLLYLARTANLEEAYFHTLPDNVWTEVGAFTELGANAWQGYGVRQLPRNVLRHVFGGRVQGIGRPRKIVNYHTHPRLFVRRALRLAGLPPEYERVVHFPSSGDFYTHAKLQAGFARQSTVLASKVAVPDALISFDVSDGLKARILSGKRLGDLLEMKIYEAARMAFGKSQMSRRGFPAMLTSRLKARGFQGDEFRLSVDSRALMESGSEE